MATNEPGVGIYYISVPTVLPVTLTNGIMVTLFLSKDYQTLVNHTSKVLRPSALTALLEVDFTATSPHHSDKILDLPTRKSKIEEPKFSPNGSPSWSSESRLDTAGHVKGTLMQPTAFTSMRSSFSCLNKLCFGTLATVGR